MSNRVVYAMANQKGGVGKTMSVFQLAAAMTHLGKRVLAIDLDPQASLTGSFQVERGIGEPTVYQVLHQRLPLAEAIIEVRHNLLLLPANLELAQIEMQLVAQPGREGRLKKAMDVAPAFDVALIDTSPSMGILAWNALSAATGVLVPVQMSKYAVEGLDLLQGLLDQVAEYTNPGLTVAGYFATMFDGRRVIDTGYLENLRARFGGKVFQTPIRQTTDLNKALVYGQDILAFAPESIGALDYTNLAKEILAKEESHG